MSLLFYEPFDAYELNGTAFANRHTITGNTTLTRNYNGVTGRPSGSIFWRCTVEGIFSVAGHTDRETIVYVALYPVEPQTGFIVFKNGFGTNLFSIQLGISTAAVVSNGTVFTATAGLGFNTWNFLEIRSVISTGSIPGSVQLKNNGQLLFSASNINTNQFNNSFPFLGQLEIEAGSATTGMLVDDILVLNTAGSTFNGPIGSGNFFMTSFVPSGSGFYTNMTSSGASTDAAAINERPANNDTNYLIATASGPFPLRETFTLRPANTASVFAALPSNSVINGVLKTSVVRSSLGDFGTFNHLLRTNTQDYTGSRPISASSTYTYQIDGWQTNPNTGTNFSVSEINNLQVGFIRES